jgi:hypothetical protein
VVDPQSTGSGGSACRTYLQLTVRINGLWLNSGDKEKHGICLPKLVIYPFRTARSRCELGLIEGTE